MRQRLRRPSPALIISIVALGIALSGTSWAARLITSAQIGTGQVRSIDIGTGQVRSVDIGTGQVRSIDIGTGQVRSIDIANNGVTGTDVNEGTLGTVPTANQANAANTANSATTAGTAATANVASNLAPGRGNAAFSFFHNGNVDIPDSAGPVATVNVPAGSYWVVSTFRASNAQAPDSTPICELLAEGDEDGRLFDVAGDNDGDEVTVSLQLVHVFNAPGQIVLSCQDGGIGDVEASFIKITALQLGSVTSTPF